MLNPPFLSVVNVILSGLVLRMSEAINKILVLHWHAMFMVR